VPKKVAPPVTPPWLKQKLGRKALPFDAADIRERLELYVTTASEGLPMLSHLVAESVVEKYGSGPFKFKSGLMLWVYRGPKHHFYVKSDDFPKTALKRVPYMLES